MPHHKCFSWWGKLESTAGEMSTPGGGGSNRGIRGKPQPPIKGSFPLDHFGECMRMKEDYEKCMKVSFVVAAFCAAGVCVLRHY